MGYELNLSRVHLQLFYYILVPELQPSGDGNGEEVEGREEYLSGRLSSINWLPCLTSTGLEYVGEKDR